MTPINPRHLLLSAALLLQSVPASAQGVFPGADENTPSLAHYFTWINNTNEGATAAQTQTNLAFFQWLKNDYGMTLDIHAFDAGVIDAPKYYGTPETRKFKGQFPQRFGPLAEQAKGFGGRLGVWLGPDGFGNTPREEKARIDFLTSLCRDHKFQLFKMDAVCTQLREDKQDAFVRLMESCRKHSPDLILLNHRLELGKAEPHATTFLWEGAETYIDVHMVNTTTAPHNRAGALGRGLPPELKRLAEERVAEVEAFKDGKPLDRAAWRASNLFAHPDALPATAAWSAGVTVDEITPTSYLCVAVEGKHGKEGCYAAIRRNGKLIGAPDRASSYPVISWENPVRGRESGYTYFFPLDPSMVGEKLEIVLLGMKGGGQDLQTFRLAHRPRFAVHHRAPENPTVSMNPRHRKLAAPHPGLMKGSARNARLGGHDSGTVLFEIMSKRFRPLAALLILSIPLEAAVDFARDVRPILNANCTACHGGVKEAGEVSFIYRDKALGKGESGKPVIVPGKPDASEMIARITSKDPDEVMPKPEHGPPLSSAQIATLRQWITEGAKWGEHWSFVAPENHPRPPVRKTDWPIRGLDHFILGRLESEKLNPSPAADPAQWLRRASFDLTGLPPTIDELDAFQKAASADLQAAIEKETDRLLASPHFGERWASVWMDLARYADSAGYADDGRREVWKYRDWLIDAFNRDLPFDQFTIEQIAGDLIPNATLDQKIATTFSRLTQVNSEGGTDDEEFRVAAVIDRMSTTWEAWMGISFGCVQCHSHPYDPIQHEEFYQFMEFFNQSADADLVEDLPKLAVPVDKARYADANALHNQILGAEKSLHDARVKIDSATRWQPARSVTAEAKKAVLSIVEQDGVQEFRADPNVAAGAEYMLTFPTDLKTVTALRLELLPLDEKKATHTPEWGGIIRHILLGVIDPSGKATPVPFHEAIADEAHPMHDPNGSIKGDERGWGTYSKIFTPRHATFALAEPLTVAPDSKLRVTLKNGYIYQASFPMVAKRGRISLTDQPEWISHRTQTEVVSAKQRIEEARKKLKEIPSTTTPVMVERDPAFARGTHVFLRGNWLDKGDFIKEAGTPKIFPPLPKSGERATRLDLARWIASPSNPLTARVAVNRLWLELFGTGIVPTPEDFGSAGEHPTHPELLDHLAVRFSSEMKWSVKSMLRELVTSATYRQDSTIPADLVERDAGNRLLARGPRQRLTAEMMRDHSLTAAGLISPRIGGIPAQPPLPPGVWKPFTKDEWKTPEPGDPERYRRAVYIYFKRSLLYPLFSSFDVPPRDISSKRRLVSNTPLQALTTLNDAAFHEAAIAISKRMAEAAPDDLAASIAYGYRLVATREITPDRSSELRELYQHLVAEYTAAPDTMKDLADTPEKAALAIVASVMLNLDESLAR